MKKKSICLQSMIYIYIYHKILVWSIEVMPANPPSSNLLPEI